MCMFALAEYKDWMKVMLQLSLHVDNGITVVTWVSLGHSQ